MPSEKAMRRRVRASRPCVVPRAVISEPDRCATPRDAGRTDRARALSHHVDRLARKFVRPTYDPDVGGLEAAELCKQAMMELSRAISDRPELVWVRDRPEWMPEFVWNPELPSTSRD
jgi:hypothetical protein